MALLGATTHKNIHPLVGYPPVDWIFPWQSGHDGLGLWKKTDSEGTIMKEDKIVRRKITSGGSRELEIQR